MDCETFGLRVLKGVAERELRGLPVNEQALRYAFRQVGVSGSAAAALWQQARASVRVSQVANGGGWAESERRPYGAEDRPVRDTWRGGGVGR